jgi:molybdopterin synthase catalytic subunit
MKLTYTAQMKMAARLLDSVFGTLQTNSDRLRLWIHHRPIEVDIQSVVTPRDR